MSDVEIGRAPGPGPDVISTEDMAILLGIDVDVLRAEYQRQGRGTGMQLPKAWVQAGRRRAREYQGTHKEGVRSTMDPDSPGARYWWCEGHDFVWRQLDAVRIHPSHEHRDLPANVIPIRVGQARSWKG